MYYTTAVVTKDSGDSESCIEFLLTNTSSECRALMRRSTFAEAHFQSTRIKSCCGQPINYTLWRLTCISHQTSQSCQQNNWPLLTFWYCVLSAMLVSGKTLSINPGTAASLQPYSHVSGAFTYTSERPSSTMNMGYNESHFLCKSEGNSSPGWSCHLWENNSKRDRSYFLSSIVPIYFALGCGWMITQFKVALKQNRKKLEDSIRSWTIPSFFNWALTEGLYDETWP